MFSFDFPLFYCSVSFRNALLSIFGNVNRIPQHHQQPSLSFSMIFPLLYCYSSFSIATPSVFGNAHWVLKTAPQTSSSTVSTIPLCFPYLEMCPVLWKHCPTSSPTVGTIPYFFPVQFPPHHCYFSFAKVPISIFGSAHWTLETVPNVVTNSEHHCWAHQCTL